MTLTADRLDAYLADPVLLIAEQLILEDGRPYGEVWAGFQRAFFQAVFGVRADNSPHHRLVYDERRRGESKTEDCAAAAVADLVTGPPRHTSYACAADQDQAALILDSIRGFQDRSPLLADLVVQKSIVRNPETSSELRVISADAPTSFGLRPRRVFFDELSLQPHEQLWTPLWTAIGKKATSQMVAVSMAGWDFASLGWRIRELAAKNAPFGEKGMPRSYFATREGSDLAPWLSPEVMDEQRESLHPADFARFWECHWTEPKGSWITREMYEAVETGAENHQRIPDRHYAGFVDVGLVHDPTTIAVVHLEGDVGTGTVVLDTLRTMQGSKSAPVDLEALEGLVAHLIQQYGCLTWIFEAPQAVASAQRLQKQFPQAHVEARFPTADTQGSLFGNLYHLFAAKRLRIFPHDQLKREALNLVTKTLAGRLKVVDSSAIHQDHVIALGGAAELVLTPDAYDQAMQYFGDRNAGEDLQRDVDRYLAQINAVDVEAYVRGGNADDPALAAAIRTAPGGF